jgi:hypothetical protein
LSAILLAYNRQEGKKERKKMNNLLDMSIDDIEDLAGFEVPPSGVYTMKFNTAIKQVNNKDCVEAAFEVIECSEQDDPNAAPAKAGTKFSTLYFLDNEISMGKMKELLIPVAAHFGERNLQVLVTETCKDLIVAGKVKRRADKQDKDKFYADVSGLMLA